MVSGRSELEQSQVLAWLMEELGKTATVGKNDLLDLLELINAPPNLQVLFLALENLPQILDKAKAIRERTGAFAPKIDFSKIAAICNHLVSRKSQLMQCAVLCQIFPDESLSKWSQLLGKFGSNPLYACLCFKPVRADLSERYYQLQAQVLLSAKTYQDSGKDLSDLEDGFLAVRKLSEGKHSHELRALPEQLVPAADYLALLRRADSESFTYSAGRILAAAYLGRRKREGGKRESRRNQVARMKVALESLEDYENPAGLWTGDDFIPKGVLTANESENYEKMGGSAAEFTGGQDYVPIPSVDERFISNMTLKELAYQGKQRSNQEALKNQLNPLGWNELNQYDVFILCGYLHEEGEGTASNPDCLFVRDCLNLMFWLSSSLERVLLLRKFAGVPESGSAEGLYLKSGNTLIARLHSPGPPLDPRNISQTSKLACPVKYYINIPLPSIAHTKSLLNACRTAPPSSRAGSPEPDKLPEEFIDSVSGQIREELGTLNRKFGTRLSAGRINHYWLHALSREPKMDFPNSMLFFGRNERFSVARLHYTCASAQTLEGAYRRVSSSVLKDLGYPAGFPSGDLANDDLYLGTPFSPLPESIKNLVMNLRRAVEQSRPARNNVGMVKNFHNHYAIYTAFMIAFATTYRAVNDPSFFERDIHFASGLGLISDKDDETFYHSRFVWIPEVCRKQITYYRSHLLRLIELYGLYWPSLTDLFRDLDLYGRPLNLFLILNENDAIVELGPTLMGDFVKKCHNYDLRINAHRHYLKNKLLDRGCPLEVIEGQLGHWEQGQEPWNRLACINPREFCRQLDPHLSKILKQDKWIAIKGCDL